MNNTFKKGTFLVLILIGLSQLSFGQGISKKREYSGFFDTYYYRGPLSITLGGGTTLYHGEIAKGFIGSPAMDLNLGLNYKIWPRVRFGLEFNYFSMAAAKGDSIGTAFAGKDWSIHLYGRYYLIEDIIRKAKDRKSDRRTKPYITAGVGLMRFNAVGTPLGGATGMTPTFPVGFGIEFKISQKLQVIPEVSYQFLFNDLIDASNSLKGKDSYIFAGIKLQYSPFAPKKKKKLTTPPADPNQNRQEHQEWRVKKKEAPKQEEEYKLPGNENTEEENPDQENTEEQNTEEENPDQENTEEQNTEEENPEDKQ